MIVGIIILISVLLYVTAGVFVLGRMVRWNPDWIEAGFLIMVLWPISLCGLWFYWVYLKANGK